MINTDSNNKNLVMVYPIKPYTHRTYLHHYPKTLNINGLDLYWEKTLNLRPGAYTNRCKLINVLIDDYRKNDFKINWIMFGKNNNPEFPQIDLKSEIFEIKPEDRTISCKVTFDDLDKRGIYPDALKIISKLGYSKELVFGGFHSYDCIKRYVEAACQLEIDSHIDELLTEQFFKNVYTSFEYDLDRRLQKNGSMLQFDDDDDPNEMKRLLFNNRLNGYL